MKLDSDDPSAPDSRAARALATLLVCVAAIILFVLLAGAR